MSKGAGVSVLDLVARGGRALTPRMPSSEIYSRDFDLSAVASLLGPFSTELNRRYGDSKTLLISYHDPHLERTLKALPRWAHPAVEDEDSILEDDTGGQSLIIDHIETGLRIGYLRYDYLSNSYVRVDPDTHSIVLPGCLPGIECRVPFALIDLWVFAHELGHLCDKNMPFQLQRHKVAGDLERERFADVFGIAMLARTSGGHALYHYGMRPYRLLTSAYSHATVPLLHKADLHLSPKKLQGVEEKMISSAAIDYCNRYPIVDLLDSYATDVNCRLVWESLLADEPIPRHALKRISTYAPHHTIEESLTGYLYRVLGAWIDNLYFAQTMRAPEASMQDMHTLLMRRVALTGSVMMERLGKGMGRALANLAKQPSRSRFKALGIPLSEPIDPQDLYQAVERCANYWHDWPEGGPVTLREDIELKND